MSNIEWFVSDDELVKVIEQYKYFALSQADEYAHHNEYKLYVMDDDASIHCVVMLFVYEDYMDVIVPYDGEVAVMISDFLHDLNCFGKDVTFLADNMAICCDSRRAI